MGKCRKSEQERLRNLSISELQALVRRREDRLRQQRASSSTPGAQPASSRDLTIGSAFTGWAAEAQALKQLQAPCVHEFGCDKLTASHRFCTANFHYKKWFSNVFEDFKGAVSAEIFCAGFPCQPYSQDGRREGGHDSRSNVLIPVLEYIRTRRPRTCVLEN
eukprot:4387807-Pyramimonas_sp.AAC.1